MPALLSNWGVLGFISFLCTDFAEEISFHIFASFSRYMIKSFLKGKNFFVGNHCLLPIFINRGPPSPELHENSYLLP